jgi:ribosomal protein S18 acetylase RimI-like enzyme
MNDRIETDNLTVAPVRIKPFLSDHIQPALALWRQCDGIALSEMDTPENVQRYLARNPDLSHVACNPAGHLVGAALCGHDGRRGYVHHLAVASNHRRLGIGRRLIHRCTEALQRIGIPKCHLFVIAGNDDGERFWQRIGWQVRTDLRIVSRWIGFSEDQSVL